MEPAAVAERLARLPDPRLATAWFGFAHAALLAAAVMIAAEPHLLAATFYHPHLLAAVHLLTLGWISGAILGALHLVPPMAMRVRVPRHRGDFVAWWTFATGTSAIAASFWLGETHGVAAGGALALAAAAWVARRTLPPLVGAPVPPAVRSAFALAFAGFAFAALLGIAVALGVGRPNGYFAPTFAHAHAAALGWVLLVVLGAGYRLLPMLLPAAMPSGRRAAATVAAIAAASLLLPLGLILGYRGVELAGSALALAGVMLLARDVAWMLRHRKPVPPARPRPDLPLAHVAAAGLAFAASATCGVALSLSAAAPPGLRAAYGVLGLLGGFGQLVAGVAPRLVGWLAWLHAYTSSAFARVPPTPYALLPRGAQRLALGGWLAAVPALAGGAAFGSDTLVCGGAIALAVGTMASAFALATAATRARRSAAERAVA